MRVINFTNHLHAFPEHSQAPPMNLELALSTRMAIRAAAVAAAAVLVGRIPGLDRPYWIILTAVVLVYETAGESIKRAGQRLLMTLLGCLAGGLLYRFAAPVPVLRWAILLGGIYMAVYFRSNPRGAVYAPMIFFVSVYVVFVFALVGGWTAQLFLTRAYDTAIGCALALAGSLFVLPLRAGRQLVDDLEQFWQSCRRYFDKSISSLSAAAPLPTSEDRQILLKQLEQLKTRSRNSAYEGMPGRKSRQRQQNLVDGTEAMSRHLLAFGAVIGAGLPLDARPQLLDLLEKTVETMRKDLDRLTIAPAPASGEVLAGEKSADMVYPQAVQKLIATEKDRGQLLQMGPAIYHLSQARLFLQTLVN